MQIGPAISPADRSAPPPRNPPPAQGYLEAVTAEYDQEDGRPGSMGPELDALDEDLLSADLEADLDGDFGRDLLAEHHAAHHGPPQLARTSQNSFF